MVITSKSNPTIKRIASLSEKKYRKEYGLYVVDGIKPVNECILSGQEIETIVCTEEYANSYPNALVVSDIVFAYLSEEKTPQGVLAVVKIPDRKIVPPTGPCLLLDNIQDPGNMGTIIRTANAAGYRQIYAIHCVDAYSPKVVRSSMSGIFFVRVYNGELQEVLSALDGVALISADMDGQDIFDFVPPKQYCLCIGNEGNGLSDEVMSHSDHTIKIPMEKTCESLNAGVSAGIAMYLLKRSSL